MNIRCLAGGSAGGRAAFGCRRQGPLYRRHGGNGHSLVGGNALVGRFEPAVAGVIAGIRGYERPRHNGIGTANGVSWRMAGQPLVGRRRTRPPAGHQAVAGGTTPVVCR